MDAIDVNAGSLLDRSGNNHHGTITGTPTPVVAPGRVGEALDYSATTIGYVDLPTLPVSSGAGASTTVSFWFFRDGPAVDEVLLFLPPGPGTAPPRYDLWLTTREGDASLCINGGTGECWGFTDPSLLDRWVHVVVVFANGPTVDVALYVDGAPVSMSCVFGTCDAVRVVQPPVTLGGSDSYSFHGKLDDVRIIDRAVDADEAASLFACVQ